MFNNDIFEKWLDKKSSELVDKIGEEKALTSEEMIILVLKAQANHFAHLDRDLRTDMLNLRQDMDKRFDKMHTVLMWGFGLMFTLFAGLYIPMLIGFSK